MNMTDFITTFKKKYLYKSTKTMPYIEGTKTFIIKPQTHTHTFPDFTHPLLAIHKDLNLVHYYIAKL